jgi:hypothetical protein
MSSERSSLPGSLDLSFTRNHRAVCFERRSDCGTESAVRRIDQLLLKAAPKGDVSIKVLDASGATVQTIPRY